MSGVSEPDVWRGEDEALQALYTRAWISLMRGHHTACAAFTAHLKPLDLSLSQYELLANLLAHRAPLTQQELADRLFVTKGNITGLLQRLEERALVERRTDPEDRRKNHVSLTATGEALAQRAVSLQHELVAEVFGELDEAEVTQLRALLRKVRQGAARYASRDVV